MIIQTRQFNNLSLAESIQEDFEVTTEAPNGYAWKTFVTLTNDERDYFDIFPSQRIEIYKLLLKEQIAYLKELDNYC